MPKIKGKVIIDHDACKGCNLCVVVCPVKILELSDRVNGKGYNYASVRDPEACTGCANCAMVCPDSCITVYRQRVEIE